ncbi:MAG TPA: citrate lyase acyl carrier protein [Clostridia bacterium]|nr:citrate lyase acyl carrier protein [Clostridia bacterium]
MCQITKKSYAGSLESSDVLVQISPNPGKGLEIDLKSTVKRQFGSAILATANEVLREFEVSDALISIDDKGALDCTIRARVSAAVCRAAELTDYHWRVD